MHNWMKIKLYKLLLLALSFVLLAQFSLTESFSVKTNIFNTYHAPTLDFIFQNLNWILYYLVGELLILPKLEEILLAPNPMLQIRYPSRNKIFQTVVINLAVATLSYNLVYFVVMALCSKFQNLKLLGFLFVNATLSFIAVTLLLLLISLLFTQTLSWQVGIIFGLFALAFKTNLLLFVTTPSMTATCFELICSVILAIGIYFINKKVEVM